jgi:hypothetical protein
MTKKQGDFPLVIASLAGPLTSFRQRMLFPLGFQQVNVVVQRASGYSIRQPNAPSSRLSLIATASLRRGILDNSVSSSQR